MSPKPISLVHTSDIHLGSGESHGRINPKTGHNVRFEDFVSAFSRSVDFAIEQQAHIYLFSGDAYRNAAPEPMYQKAFADQLRRLSQAGVTTILLVGNHDQILKSSGSHSMSVFQSLAVPNVITIDQPKLLTIDTAHGACQLIGIPHVTRHLLMTHEKYASLPAAEIEKTMVRHVGDILRSFYDQLDPQLPTIATAHMMVDRARAGAEQELMVGYSMTFPVDLFVDPRIDYVALGHVHGHQVLRRSSPAIVYAGSIERVDFGEADEDKGFVHVLLQRQDTRYQFHSLQPRPFITVELDVSSCKDPTAQLVEKIKRHVVAGCVLRVRFEITEEQAPHLDESAIREAAQGALSLQIKPHIAYHQRTVRMPQLTESSVVAPLNALSTYLDQVAPERKDVLLERAADLCRQLDCDQST
ncbi:MAG TPA: exonuclease SbcCD subunit D [Candidatus Obscuribacterales bacterium]